MNELQLSPIVRPIIRPSYGRSEVVRTAKSETSVLSAVASWVKHVFSTSLIIAVLIFIIFNFYLYASLNLSAFFYVFLLFSFITDGIILLFHIYRRPIKNKNVTFDPKKVTIVIPCYNGDDVLGETIRQALRHVPRQQIIVISDASTDNTEKVARNYGVRLIVNQKNLSKVRSIDKAVRYVYTPYVLIMDDDVLIGDITIPTSLLDQGYTAAAFNVMPVQENTWVNRLQVFEYRNSMQLGKNLRAKTGGIGNISGAIGLFRTRDLIEQTTLHSGQFAGEDEQRTLLVHMFAKGKGVTYTDDVVLTHAPDTYLKLYRQRAHSWSLAQPELFVLYWRTLFSPKAHYLLKLEKAYYLYIYMTDPLRILFLWVLIFRPVNLALIFGFYLLLSIMVWAKLKFKDRFSIILIYPVYKLWLTFCRFVGYFMWFKEKGTYLKNRLHKRVTRLNLKYEYILTMAVFVFLWGISIWKFSGDLNLYRKIHANRVEEPIKDFSYEKNSKSAPISMSRITFPLLLDGRPADSELIVVVLEKGDTDRAIAYKAVNTYLAGHPLVRINSSDCIKITKLLTQNLKTTGVYMGPSGEVLIKNETIEQMISQSNLTSGVKEAAS